MLTRLSSVVLSGVTTIYSSHRSKITHNLSCLPLHPVGRSDGQGQRLPLSHIILKYDWCWVLSSLQGDRVSISVLCKCKECLLLRTLNVYKLKVNNAHIPYENMN